MWQKNTISCYKIQMTDSRNTDIIRGKILRLRKGHFHEIYSLCGFAFGCENECKS